MFTNAFPLNVQKLTADEWLVNGFSKRFNSLINTFNGWAQIFNSFGKHLNGCP